VRRLIEPLEIHDAPRHGCGLAMAATGLSVLTRQRLDRRLPDAATLPRAVAARATGRNTAPARIHRQCITSGARITLKRRDPSFQD
jgi:hypothetical protein